MHAVTFIGNPAFVMPLMGVVLVGGAIKHNLRLCLAAAAVPAWIGVDSIIKLTVRRHRPPTEYVHQMLLHTYSFPSGHACASMLGYGLLGYMAWKWLPAPWGLVSVIASGILIFLVGLSRVYLGAHYPTDVIGGWLIGAIGLAIIIWLIRP